MACTRLSSRTGMPEDDELDELEELEELDELEELELLLEELLVVPVLVPESLPAEPPHAVSNVPASNTAPALYTFSVLNFISTCLSQLESFFVWTFFAHCERVSN